jgi:hypothetical protein
MTLDQSALMDMIESLRTADEGTLMRHLLALMLQQLIDAEATERIGAGRYERSPARTTQRNGSRATTVATTAGDIEVQIPKPRTGSFFPLAAGAAPAYRPGVACGGVRGVRARGVHRQGRRPDGRAGCGFGDLQE